MITNPKFWQFSKTINYVIQVAIFAYPILPNIKIYIFDPQKLGSIYDIMANMTYIQTVFLGAIFHHRKKN